MRLVWGLVLIWCTACGGRSEKHRTRPAPSSAPDASAVTCDVTVPDDFIDPAEAILAAPVPGTVCLRAGEHAGPLKLRDGVSLIGEGEGTSVCCGVDATDLLSLGSTLEAMTIKGRAYSDAGGNLSLRDLALRQDLSRDCGCSEWYGLSSGPSLEFRLDPSAVVRFSAESVTVVEGGFYFYVTASPLDTEIAVRRSRCIGAQCFDFVNVAFLGPGPAGSRRLSLVVENNLVPSSVLQSIALSGSLEPGPSSPWSTRIVNNTLLAPNGDPNYGLAFYDWPGEIVIANNVIANIGQPLFGEPEQAIVVGNVLGYDEDQSWFVDAAGGDFRPAPGSPLRDQADATYLPADDFDGRVRQFSDTGAFERAP